MTAKTAKTTCKMMTFSAKETVLEESGCVHVAPDDFTWDDLTYTFQTKPYDLSRINADKSKRHAQNRVSGKLDPEYVSQYSFCLKNGDVFPALCVFRDKDGDELVGDGLHTYESLRTIGANEVIGIYLFSHPKAITDVVPRFNVFTTGRGEPMSERMEKAIRSYMAKEKSGESPMPSRKEFAKGFRISEENFNRNYRIAEMKLYLSLNAVDVDNIKEGNAIESIAQVAKIDKEAAIEIANMASTYRLSSKDVAIITDDYLDPSKSSTVKAKSIESHNQRLKISTSNGKSLSKARKRGPEPVFKEALTKLANLAKKVDEAKLKNYMADPLMKTSVMQVKNLLARLSK